MYHMETKMILIFQDCSTESVGSMIKFKIKFYFELFGVNRLGK